MTMFRPNAQARAGILIVFALLVFINAYADDTIYVVPPTSAYWRILPDTTLPSDMISETATIFACQGEYEPASFVIENTGTSAISGVTITVNALNREGGGGSISVANVDVRVVKCWWQAGWAVDDTTHKQLAPELLLKNDSLVNVVGENNYLWVSGNYVLISDPAGIPGIPTEPTVSQFPVQDAATLQPFDIPAYSNKQLWVTVQVPTGTASGAYMGTLSLSGSGINRTLTLKVIVPGFTLLSPQTTYSLYYGGRFSETGYISSAYKNTTQFTAEMANLASHGVTLPTLYGQGSDSNLTQALSIRTAQGVSNTTLYYLGLSILTYGSDTTALQNEVVRLKALVAPYGVNNFFVYGYDEHPLDSYGPQINAVHAAGGKVFCAQSPNIYAGSLAAGLDLPILAYVPDPAYADLVHSYGREIFSYCNPQVGVEDPAVYRKNYCRLLWENDYDGAMDFAYQWRKNNIWNDFDLSGSRDHNFTYPTVNGVIDTVAWEGFREAVDDDRYLTTLTTKANQVLGQSSPESLKQTARCALAYVNTSNAMSRDDADSVRKKLTYYLYKLYSLTVPSELTPPDPTPTLRGHWSFNGIKNLPYILDKSGKLNAGTLKNMDAEVADGSAFIAGKVADGIRFISSEHQYVECGKEASLDITSAITISAWVKVTQSSAGGKIVWGAVLGGSRFILGAWQGLCLWVRTNEGWHGFTTPALSWTDGWHQVAWTYDSANHTTKLYVDGAEAFSSTTFANGPLGGTLTCVRIGGGESSSYYNGDLDEVRIYSEALPGTAIKQLFMEESLRGKWSFDELAGVPIAADGSGWDNDGTAVNMDYAFAKVAGKTGTGCHFAGSQNQMIECGNDASLDITNAITVSAWVKVAETSSNGIVWCYNTGGSSRYLLKIGSDNKLNVYVNTDQGWHDGGRGQARTWTDGWHHVAWTYDSATTKLYVDGDEDYSSTYSTGPLGGGALQLVRIGGGPNNYYNGDLDEVYIYDRALTQEEIQILATP